MGDMNEAAQAVNLATSQLSTLDGWENFMTNMGVFGKDKAEAVRFRQRRLLTLAEIDTLYRQDGMSAKIVDDIVEDGFRCGWRVTFTADENEKLNAEKVNEFNAKLDRWHQKTRFMSLAEEHMKQSRWAGGSLLILGAKDGGLPEEELKPDAIKSIDWVRPVDRYQVSGSGLLESNPGSPNFGMPVWYDIMSVVSPQGAVSLSSVGEASNEITSLNNLKLHNTRAWRSDGHVISDRARLTNNGWADSVIERAYDPLRHWSSAMKNIGTLIQDFVQAEYKIKGLKDALSSGKESLITKRFAIMDRTRSIVNAVLVDADGEEFNRVSANVSGLPELIDRLGRWLSAVSGMPLTKLFGVSPGGLGTGEGEGENWDDKVVAWQQKKLQPMLEYVYGLLFKTPEFRGVPDGWRIEFESLQLESPEQTAETRLKNAQADNFYMVNAAISPKEVRKSRWGGAKYGSDLDIDEQAREAMEQLGGEVTPGEFDEAAQLNAAAGEEPAVAAAGGDVQKSALNGAQIAELKQMILDVANGDMPLESAVSQALFSFPTMEDAEAAAMFGPAGKKAEAKAREPKPTPPTPPPIGGPQFGQPQASARRAAPEPGDEVDGQ